MSKVTFYFIAVDLMKLLELLNLACKRIFSIASANRDGRSGKSWVSRLREDLAINSPENHLPKIRMPLHAYFPVFTETGS